MSSSEIIPEAVTLIDGATATTTSAAQDIRKAKKVTFLFTRANHSSGNTVFTVTGSLDGTTFVALNKLVTNAANSNAETKVRAANVTLNANGTSLVSLDLEHDCYKEIKVTATETTDGTHTAVMLAEY